MDELREILAKGGKVAEERKLGYLVQVKNYEPFFSPKHLEKIIKFICPDLERQANEILNALLKKGILKVDKFKESKIWDLANKLHKEIRPGGVAVFGEIRTRNLMRVRGSGSIYKAPYINMIPKLLRELEDFDFCKNRLIEVILIHYQFLSIHPYQNGNGRVCRKLAPLLLLRRGYTSSDITKEKISNLYYPKEIFYDSIYQSFKQDNINIWINTCLKAFKSLLDED